MPAEATLTIPGDFDVVALCDAVEAQRAERNIRWGSMVFGWMSRSTMERMRERRTATCNHVLPMIQWLGRTPESFTVDPDGAVHELLPDLGPSGQWRWWWAHHDLAAELDARRVQRDLSWKDVADELGMKTATLQGLDRLRYGPTIGVAMIVARWVGRSAASCLTETPPAAFNPPAR